MAEVPTEIDAMARLRRIMRILRAPGGCAWDREQTHESLAPLLLEEAYEVLAAIHAGDVDNLREELGDLLLHVVMHSEIAEESGHFPFEHVASEAAEKMVRRHPHVFGDETIDDPEAILRQWDEIKRGEKGDDEKPYLHGVGVGLPALMRAQKLQKKASKVGFDWPDVAGAMAKLGEEIGELGRELAGEAPGWARARLEDEVGDILFSAVNVARKLGIDAEAALAAGNRKFEERFGELERRVRRRGGSLASSSLAELDALWEEVKGASPAAQGE